MREEFLVVSCREVRALVRPARFRPMEGTLNDCFGHVEHERELEGRRQLGVEGPAVVLEGHVVEPLLEFSKGYCCLDERSPGPVNSRASLDRLLHLLSET